MRVGLAGRVPGQRGQHRCGTRERLAPPGREFPAGRRQRGQPRDELVRLLTGLGDTRPGQRVDDDRPVGAPRHGSVARQLPAEHVPEDHVVQAQADSARADQGEIDVPEH